MANKTITYRGKFIFNYPDDELAMKNIIDNGKELLTLTYQSTLDRLDNSEKEIGFELIKKHAKDSLGIDLKLT